MIELKYAYIAANILFSSILIVVYYLRKDLRKQILVMGLLGAVAGPLSQIWYLRDYWNPDVLINLYGVALEDAFFGFSVAGVGAVIYETVLRKRNYKKYNPINKWQISTLLLLAALILVILTNILDINSIYSSIIIFLVIITIVLVQRKDLIVNSLVSGILMALVGFLTYQLIFTLINPDIIGSWWYLDNLSHILVLGVPIEEIIWWFSWGMLAGPIYEFTFGLKQKAST